MKKSLNGNIIKNYEKIKSTEECDFNKFFQNFPGAYCKNCGHTFALYSYSMHRPNGFDENKKPFYNSCFECKEN